MLPANRQASEHSLVEFCRHFDLDAGEYLEHIGKVMAARLMSYLDELEHTYSDNPVFIQLKQTKLAETQGFSSWDWMHYYQNIGKRVFIDSLAHIIHELPVNTTYLAKLITPTAAAPSLNGEALINFLRNLSEVHLFELDFNAFLTNKGYTGDQPSIVYYHTLDFVISCFYDTLIPIMIDDTLSGWEVLPDDVCARAATEPAVMEVLRKFLDLVAQKTCIYFENDHYKSKRNGVLFRSLLQEHTVEFVRLHEYSHLLLGHLEIGPCRAVEFEADALALTAFDLFKKTPAVGRRYLSEFCLAAAFFLMHLKERLFGLDALPDTHPPAVERLIQLLRQMLTGMVLSPRLVVAYFNKLTLLFHEVVTREYNVHLSILDIRFPDDAL